MRKNLIVCLLTLFSSFLYAQEKDTTNSRAWLEIDTLITKKGLTKTALLRVAAIEKKARLYQQNAQFLKCLIYRYSLEPSISEKNINDYIGAIKKDIETSKDNVVKSILYVLMAKQLEQYFDERRWVLYDRKNTTKPNSSDITTWSLNDFVSSISSAYQTALNFSSDLKQISIDRYDAILLKGNNTGLRTIYDLLLSEAIRYFKEGEKYDTQPIQSFTLNARELFSLGEQFISLPIATPDSNNHQWITLGLYKKLLAEHFTDSDRSFWIEKEIERLEWLLEYSSQKDKNKSYEDALQSLTSKWSNQPAITHAWYLIAKRTYDKGLNYTSFTDTTNRYAFAKAKQIAEQTLARFELVQNFGTTSLKNLLTDIHQQQLRVLTEIVNIPEKPFRALVEYKNITHLYGRIIQVNSSNIEIIRSHATNEYDWEDILQLKPYKKFDISLPATDDYQLHKTEIKIDALPLGQYAIVCSDKNDFADTNSLSFQRLYVSNISYIKNGGDYFVVDRETGQPMSGVKVSLKEEGYDTKTKKDFFREVAKRITDANGYFSLKGVKERATHLDFQTGKDQLFIEKENYWHNYYEQDNEPSPDEASTKRIFFFTDRNIYRPGQIVFFKGISVSKPNGSVANKIRPIGDSVWVYLFNVNHKKTDSLKCIVNGYGSFSGKFTLPQNTLTGNFSIQAPDFNYSSSNFSVEEYKRPTFSVTLDDIKTVYRLNDSIEVRGQAKAFSGSSINDAKVVFQVKRKSRFNMPWFWRGPDREKGQQEIANGTIRTDAEGKFIVRFKALPDENMTAESNPVFTFDIQLNITDNNGETRTGNKEISIGYQSLLLTINAPAVTEVNSLKKIQIGVTNTNLEKAEAKVTARLTKLQSPDRLIRKRLWDKPDQFTMTEEEFIQLFPNDEYKEETSAYTWQTEKLVLTQIIDTRQSDTLHLEDLSLKAGYYKIEISTKDKDSVPVMQEHIFLLTDQANGNLGFPSYQMLLEQKTTIEPGDTASFLHGFSFNKAHIIQKTEKPNQKATYQFLNRNKGFTNNRFTATEADRGGILVTEAYVIHNRVYTNEQRISVPWTNKQLEINYKSFRNKTEPGSKEQWSVHITPPQNADKNGIELLTAMYDASLDLFKSTNWSKPAIWATLNIYNQFDYSSGFEIGQPVINEPEINYLPYIDISYDRIAREAYELCIANLSFWKRDSTLSITYFTSPKIVADQIVRGYGLNEVIRQETKSDALNESAEVIVSGYQANKRKMAAATSIQIRGLSSFDAANTPIYVVDGKIVTNIESINPDNIESLVVLKGEEATSLYGSRAAGGAVIVSTNKQTPLPPPVTIRKNFNETAFFFPHLYADTAGNYSFSFTMPDALTKWKWMSLAHSKDLAFGTNSTSIITQKTLMVQANAPRFIREGDKMEFSAKISNLSEKELSGQVTLELIDAATGNSVDGWFQNVFPVQYFTAAAGQSTAIKFPIQVPFSFNKTLNWKLVARSANYSDGEENMLPVLTNRQLVTESLPIFIKKDTTQSFRFEKLIQTNSPSLTHEAITINYTANPIWEAIRALPYLMEYPYECVEQTFNRFYANALGSYIVNKDPKIKKVFEAWAKDTASQKSKLQLNESLKQIMLEETPWVLAGQSEEQQQKNLALLFDVFRLNQQSEQLVQKLQDMQLADGSFSWFKGGYSDRYMTSYVITGLGKLKRIGALSPDIAIRLKQLTDKAIQFMDEELNKEYQYWRKTKLDTTRTLISNTHIQYLYMRSFYRDVAPSRYREAYNFFYERGKYQIQKQSIYNRALLGLVYYRNNEIRYVNVNIRAAILENAVRDTVKSVMYWKDRQAYSWYQTPIEHQSTMIQFLQELQQGQPQYQGNQSIDEARNWLLLNKQTNHWKTTVATAEACYALLMTGSDRLHAEKNVRIQLGANSYSNQQQQTEAGTGYFQQRIEGHLVKPEMGNIKVTVQTTGASSIQSPSWGSIYWQYFEDMDKITRSATPLSVTKQLFIERNSNSGKVLEAIKENEVFKPGDKVVIRLTLKTDREMEYLHLKDTRASTMEPVNVLSGFKWQDGLGYYESTKDASTNFFISQLRRGTYVFDYSVFITHTGEFSTGNASIQCMYAPEFVANSGGMKIRVEE